MVSWGVGGTPIIIHGPPIIADPPKFKTAIFRSPEKDFSKRISSPHTKKESPHVNTKIQNADCLN